MANYARLGNGEALAETLKRIRAIKTGDGSPAYEVDWEILNTADDGILQSRRRLFTVRGAEIRSRRRLRLS